MKVGGMIVVLAVLLSGQFLAPPQAFGETEGGRRLVAVPIKGGKIFLGWRCYKTDGNRAGYQVKRSEAPGGPYVSSAFMDSTMGTYVIDSTTVSGKTYYYYLTSPTGISETIRVTASESGKDCMENYSRPDSSLQQSSSGMLNMKDEKMEQGKGKVIFQEDFESGDLGKRWEKYSEDPARGGFESRPEHVHSGTKSYRVSSPAYTGEGRLVRGGRISRESDSWIRTWFLPGHDTVFIRWYTKFAEDFEGKGMHWCQFWACRPDNPQSVLGGAGRRPDGTDRFIVNVEPLGVDNMPPPGQLVFYTYWPDMPASGDGRYWGSYFFPERPFFIERGRWYCYEMMIKCNQPGVKDGEQALWIDGEKILHMKGIRWRDVESLKVNMAMFGNYSGHSNVDRVYWMDDLVISTDYVGPMKK